ncbi:two-component system sensor histidine kinase NtrB [Anaeroselena agilis]|uniref:histidine kinase n=1 Tax=Anaeroselena agilis TaxID=3063788 RepID=A0ABU3P295_9FIRM|nr:ATP-binding protein [Selenomonadales bacterium 4137-cl]
MPLPALLQVVLDAIPGAALIADVGHRVVYLNKCAEALLALPRTAGTGRRLPNTPGLAWLGPLLQNQTAFKGEQASIPGRPATVLVDATPLPPGGGPGKTLVIIRETPGTCETALRTEQLESLAGIGEIAAGAIHEIRNPLTSVSGFIQLMRARAIRQADQTTTDYCTLIAEEIGHINSILSDFLSLARSRKTEFTAVDIVQLVRDVQNLIYGEAILSGVTVAVRLPGEPLLIRGNGDKIKEVLINLARNAFQAMPEGGVLTISALAVGPAVRVDVADTGQGIAGHAMADIFKPFYTTKESGTGLGLAISRRIVEDHRGEITVSSEVGKGTVFALTFPRLPSDDTFAGMQ